MRRVDPSDFYEGPTVVETTSEAMLRKRVVELAHAAGWRVFSLPIAKQSRPVKDAIGYPDLTLARHRSVLWLELKTDKGRVSEVQSAWLDALPNAHIVTPADLNNGRLVRLLARGTLG